VALHFNVSQWRPYLLEEVFFVGQCCPCGTEGRPGRNVWILDDQTDWWLYKTKPFVCGNTEWNSVDRSQGQRPRPMSMPVGWKRFSSHRVDQLESSKSSTMAELGYHASPSVPPPHANAAVSEKKKPALVYRMVSLGWTVFRYLEPFRSDLRLWETDRQTETLW